jgi:CRP/FNR family transcriptional regulator, cyclic AMP receptor protein
MMESLEQRIEALQNVPAFAELTAARLKPAAHAAQEVRFRAGEVIVHQGDPGDAIYVLTDGTAEVWLMDAPQGPALLRTIGPGHLFGETAVLYKGPRSATIKARTYVTTLRIAGEIFLDLARSNAEVALYIATTLAQRLASDRRALTVEPRAS